MPQNGTNIAQDLEDSFNNVVSAPAKMIGGAVDKVKSIFSGGSSGSSSSDTDYNKAYHAQMLKAANDSLKAAADKSTPAPKAATPKKGSLPSYKTGTDNVPKTGPALLHKGEAVLPKEDAKKLRQAKGTDMSKESVMKEAGSSLTGKPEAKPKKEVEEIRTRKAKNGGYIHKHMHTHPEHHPDEEHISKNQDEMAQHMLEHMGEPNPGEAEADAGQSGIPGEAAGAPQAGAPASGGAQPIPGM